MKRRTPGKAFRFERQQSPSGKVTIPPKEEKDDPRKKTKPRGSVEDLEDLLLVVKETDRSGGG